MRRALSFLLPLLLVGMAVARVMLARAEKEERERTMASLLAHQAEFDQQRAAKERERLDAERSAAMKAELARIEEMGRAIEVPKPLTLGTSPGAGSPAEPTLPAYDWNTTPHSLWVSYADLSKAAAAQARSEEVVSPKARKALVARLGGIHERLVKALAGKDRFADAAVVRAELAQAEAARAELDGALKATSVHGKMTRENLDDLLEMLRVVPGP